MRIKSINFVILQIILIFSGSPQFFRFQHLPLFYLNRDLLAEVRKVRVREIHFSPRRVTFHIFESTYVRYI